MRALDGGVGAWDETNFRTLAEVAREARNQKPDVHWGVLFDLCVEKNSELPKGHTLRKFKERVVFAGNRTKNQNWEAAMFQELSSSPPAMEVGKAYIAHGLAV